MSLKAIECKECGANIKLDSTTNGTVICEYCGTTYTVDRNKTSNLNLAYRGLEFIEISEFDNADMCFDKILENDINYYIAYLGKAQITNLLNEDGKKLLYYLEKAIELSRQVSYNEKCFITKLLKTTNPKSNTTLLDYAVGNDNYDAVKFLLDNGADVNRKGLDRFYSVTPLHVVSYYSRQNINAPKIARLLLEYGADESALCENGRGVINDDTSPDVINVIKELRPNSDLSIKNGLMNEKYSCLKNTANL